jgi:hypothetical protein
LKTTAPDGALVQLRAIEAGFTEVALLEVGALDDKLAQIST